jgi:hypothetical protein
MSPRIFRYTIFILTALAAVARAGDISVRATLNRTISVIGDPVQYQVKITGARRVGQPPEIAVDGLDIQFAGKQVSSNLRLDGGTVVSESSLTMLYQIVPGKNGAFTIPALAIEADGKTFRTEPIGLTVQPSSTNPTGSDPQTIGFAEFVIPKKTAYIGEMIPLEFRLYVDARVRWQPVKMPEITGEGFTMQKMPEPQRAQMEKNGREYDVLVFKTAVTPSRAGKITIGPSEIPYNARVPRARRSGSRSLFDMFDDDVFGDSFYATNQQLKAKAEAVEIYVKPLPAAGRPREFSGAVGHFEFSAEGAPKQVKIGDPVTMKLRVSGQGNFDRMTAPALKDASGWRAYPPSSAFKADDELGYKGTKTFEMAVVPETKQAQMPAFEFTYFDPLAEKYVTLNSAPAPLVVEGGAPLPPPAIVADDAPASPAISRVKPAGDIVGLRYDHDAIRSFAPLYERREFWLAQGALGLVLIGVVALRLRRRPDAAVLTTTALRRERAAALARLRNAQIGHTEFFETAARVAQIETALATNRPAQSVDAAVVRNSARLDEPASAVIDEIFSVRAELLYAGGTSGDEAIPLVERERVLTALEQLGKAYGKD